MYGAYQYLDAHPVKMAHNDYLQAFAETGIFGFLLFVGFWSYFVIRGGACILNETVASQKIVLVGMYCGVLAFLTHSFFDFNFQNPTLATTGYLMAGLFYARVHVYSQSTDAEPETLAAPVRISRWAAVGGILILSPSM